MASNGSNGKRTARDDRRRHDGLQEGSRRATNGDMDAAVEFLRKNGQAKAEKKASRIAAEGLLPCGNRRRSRRQRS